MGECLRCHNHHILWYWGRSRWRLLAPGECPPRRWQAPPDRNRRADSAAVRSFNGQIAERLPQHQRVLDTDDTARPNKVSAGDHPAPLLWPERALRGGLPIWGGLPFPLVAPGATVGPDAVPT